MERGVHFMLKSTTVCLLLGAVRTSSVSFSGSLVTPRMFTVMADPEGGDWNTARETCASVNMSLATVDLHGFAFLLSQTVLRQFQKYSRGHFWIGLYDENTRNQTSAIGEYRWTEQCEPMSAEWMFWDDGQPRNSGNAFCVYASNSTLRWKTDKCSAKHQYLCQRREQSCRYNHTLPTCTLYITASKRRAVPTASTTDCSLKCDSTLVGDLPCWGFTMTSSGCVLHYQASQPNCEAVHHRSSAIVRTCFQMFYVEGPFNRTPQSNDKELPAVPMCDQQDTATAPSTPAAQTTEQRETSAEVLNTTFQTTAIVTSTAPPAEEATGTTPSADEPSTAHVEAEPRVTKPYQPSTVIQASAPVVKPEELSTVPEASPPVVKPEELSTVPEASPPVVKPEELSTVPEASPPVVKPEELSTVPEASPPVVKPDELSTVSNVSLPVFTHNEQSAVTEADPPVSKPPDTQVSMSRYPSHQCPCNCDVIKRNKTSALRAAEVTKLSLTVQVKTLSSTRRRKKSASDFRVSSRSIAYLGVSFVVLASSIIILPDFVRIGHHLRYGVPIEERKPRKRACHIP